MKVYHADDGALASHLEKLWKLACKTELFASAAVAISLCVGLSALHGASAQAFSAASGSTGPTRDIIFDMNHTHPFMGLGAVMWPGDPFPDRQYTVAAEINLTWARVPLQDYFNSDDLTPGMSVTGLLREVPSHEIRASVEHLSNAQVQELGEADTRITQRYANLEKQLIHERVKFVIVALPGAPKAWVKQFQYEGTKYETFLGGQDHSVDHRVDFITFSVAEMIAAKRAGLKFNIVEFANEPDEPGSGMRSDVFNSMINLLREKMDQAGLGGVAISTPGTGSPRNAPRYIAALRGPGGNLKAARYFSVHDYDTAQLPAPAGLSPAFLASTGNLLPIIVTEFNDASRRWYEPPYKYGPTHKPADRGLTSDNSVNHAEYGVGVAAEALKLIGDGALAVCVWEMSDQYWGNATYGLIDLRGHVRPTVAALASFMSVLGRESIVAATQGRTAPGLAATAFRVSRTHQPDDLVAAFANVTSGPLHLRLHFFGDVGFVPRFKVVSGFPAENMAQIRFDSSAAELVIPGNTIAVISNAPN